MTICVLGRGPRMAAASKDNNISVQRAQQLSCLGRDSAPSHPDAAFLKPAGRKGALYRGRRHHYFDLEYSNLRCIRKVVSLPHFERGTSPWLQHDISRLFVDCPTKSSS